MPALQAVASDVTPQEIKDAGHYLPEDQPSEVIRALASHFG